MATHLSLLEIVLFVFFLFISNVSSAVFSPARPPAIPLAVRSPYLSTWLPGGSSAANSGILAGQWPIFWNGVITGWTGLIRVDGTTYTWMGNPVGPKLVTQTAFRYTSTRSIFTQRVNNAVELTVTFLSPVTPNNLLVGSIISSYMHVSVRSLDGKKHNVQLYTDVSGEWASGNRASKIKWDYGVTQSNASPKGNGKRDEDEIEDLPVHHAKRAGHLHHLFHRSVQTNTSSETLDTLTTTSTAVTTTTTETNETEGPSTTHGELWTTITLTTTRTATSSVSSGTPTTVAQVPNALRVNVAAVQSGIAYHHFYKTEQDRFAENNDQTEYGQWYYMTKSTNKLTHQSGPDINVRARFITNGKLANTADRNFRAISDQFPVFAYAVDLGSVGKGAVSTTFTISLNQQQAVQFLGVGKKIRQIASLWTSYFNSDIAANAWFYKQFANNLASSKNLDTKIQTASVKTGGQNYATITTLAVRQAFGSIQLTDTPGSIKAFMKEISSNGNTNTVDVIFPFSPIALYLNPKILRYLLDPLLINQEAGNWPYKFSIHDIGTHYPNAVGHPDGNAEQMPLEECGNMLIMALAYAQRSGDNAWLRQHYPIFKQWTSFLIDEALIPADQLSTDDFAGPIANSTNQALKGIIGIDAMARIAKRTGHPKDEANFARIAKQYITKWQKLGAGQTNGRKHTTLQYGNTKSWSLLYNLWADKLLGLNLVPKVIYDRQSAWYPRVMAKEGIPLDSRHTYTKVDWEMFCAAVASKSTRNLILERVATYVKRSPTNRGFPDWYSVKTGDFAGGFRARPVIGGVFAILAL